MPYIDFYLLNTLNKVDIYRFLCRLVDKAFQQQRSSCIYTSFLEDAHCIDDLLWTFRDISFIPHQIHDGVNVSVLPVTIAVNKPNLQSQDILFNLTQEIPAFFSSFSRIIEVVTDEKVAKVHARKKYKLYKEQNCQLTTHHINLAC
jgi:DNA polymerase III subunit chi